MIITRTPFRISFFGGGTDYPEYFLEHGGAVLGTAIDASCYLSINQFHSRLFEYSIRIAYRITECVSSLDELQHAPFRECMRLAGVASDVEINYAADLPSFSGMGTSSSFVVGLLKGLHAFRGRHISPNDLAVQAIHMEREILGESVGCQDQAFAAVGGFNLIEFRSLDSIVVHRLPLTPQRISQFESHLMLFYTGIRRRASEMALKQVRKVAENQHSLKTMREMVDEGYDILTSTNDFSGFGELMHRSWMLKASLDESISNSTIASIYQAGLDAGALGGKLLGAGGGGFVLFFVPPERQDAVRAKLAHLDELKLRVNAPGSHIIHA